MPENLATKALSLKKKTRLTPLEIEQISDMQKAYGKNNIISAIRFSKSAQINDVAKMLLQHCGLRTVLPPSIKSILPDKLTAEKTWTPEKFQIALRLANATLSVENEINQHAQSLLKFVESKIEQNRITTSITYAINGSVRKYGIALARHGIEIITWTSSVSDEQKIRCYQDWLLYSSQKNWTKAEQVLQEIGISGIFASNQAPLPVSIRLNKYFVAKANRTPTDKENDIMWNMLDKNSIDEIIHAMSCVPAVEFSIQKVEQLLTNSSVPKPPSRKENHKNYDDYDPYRENAIYKIGDVVEINRREARYWRIENYNGEYYVVSVVDYDGYIKEYIFSGTAYYIKANNKFLHMGKCVDNVLIKDEEKNKIIEKAKFWEQFFDEDDDDEEDEDVYFDRRAVQKKQDYEDNLYDYSDFDSDGADSDNIFS